MRFKPFLLILVLCFGLSACSGGVRDDKFEVRPTVMGVNGFLWQASLDTLVFMPLDNVDQSNGVLVTDWMISPANDQERVKVTVRFLSDELRSDAVRVIVIREIRQNDVWVIAPVQASTSLQIEEAILTQARRLRIEAEEG